MQNSRLAGTARLDKVTRGEYDASNTAGYHLSVFVFDGCFDYHAAVFG